jgi:hypothetical protein
VQFDITIHHPHLDKLLGRWDMKAKTFPKAFKEGIDLSLQPKMENREEENINISDCVATYNNSSGKS